MPLLNTNMIAQEDRGWGNLLYLLIFFILPALKALGTKLREKFGKETPEDLKDLPTSKPPMMPRPVRTSSVRGERTRRPATTDRPVARVSPRMAQPVPARPDAQPVRTGDAPSRIQPTPPPRARPVARRRPSKVARPVAAETRTPVPESKPIHTIQRIMKEEAQQRLAESRAEKPRASLLPKHLDREALRRAVILSEILQPPLGLRDLD
ncbi:MAG: hypothetical protein IID39_10680 [Planctomycetes bacterium]|nr:hypothetical protein [Planctomycetota bacterium]